jgi:serine/threonine protein kinase
MNLVQIGKYQVIAKIGQGAMGEVYKARDPVLGRFVAIKTISQRTDPSDVQRQRFLREARAAAQLNHPNIITIFEFGEEEGTAFIAMELLEGTDLKEIIETRAPLALGDKLSILEQICDGLAYAHGKGLVHRDLKPGNIHILPNGQVKIMDFGLARQSQDPAKSAVVMGTPYYMAPEQAQGGRASARSDIFSVGAVFYELLAGRRPFGGDTVPAVLYGVVHKPVEPLAPSIPELPALAAIVEKALAKDPDERFENAGELRKALGDVRQAYLTGQRYDPAAATVAGVAPPRSLPRPAPKTLSEAADTAEPIKEALFELQQYLADRVPPLMVADSVNLLLGLDPGGVASDIYAWALQQSRAQSLVPLSDFLFYALRKLHLMGEFKLVEKERLDGYMHELGDAVLGYCSPQDQEALRPRLAGLGRESLSAPVVEVHPRGAQSVAFEKRYSHLLRLLSWRETAGRAGGGEAAWSQLISQALTTAVGNASSQQELDQNLARLNQFGVVPGVEQIFRSLGQGMSGWVLPQAAGALAPENRGEVEAMRRIIALAEEPLEVARRFRGMVYAAIEQFNAGNLGKAVKVFDLAEQLIHEKQIEGGLAETIRRKGHESLDPDRLRKFAESPDKHAQLRTVLEFFHYGLGPKALLDDLQAETKRERRRLLLDLLQAHGSTAREPALKRLEAHRAGQDDPGPYMLRNLVYLLRMIPRAGEEGIDREIDLLAGLADPGGGPPFVAREAITTLAAMKSAKAKQSLVNLLHAYEGDLGKVPVPARGEGQAMLDKICSALVRSGHPTAWNAVLEHAFSERAELGSTIKRLAEFSSQDLSTSPPTLASLLAELKANLPSRMMGFLVTKKDQMLACIIEALSGTPREEVREALTEVVRRFSGHGFAKAAVRALEGFAERDQTPPAPPLTANDSGDLDMFGLPGLLQRLADKRATGLLTLLDSEGAPKSALTLEGGRVRTCQIGGLQGGEAFLQLLERPFAGAFSLIGRPPNSGAAGEFLDLDALTSEGIRRHIAFQKASALVPDDIVLEATGTSPTAVPSEEDYSVVVVLWEKACAGVTPRQCEADVPADSFRIRRALGHWVEEEALRPRADQ